MMARQQRREESRVRLLLPTMLPERCRRRGNKSLWKVRPPLLKMDGENPPEQTLCRWNCSHRRLNVKRVHLWARWSLLKENSQRDIPIAVQLLPTKVKGMRGENHSQARDTHRHYRLSRWLSSIPPQIPPRHKKIRRGRAISMSIIRNKLPLVQKI